MSTSRPTFDKHLLFQALIFFQILSLIKLKIEFLLMRISDDNPKYLLVPSTT
jgi:hypothetical protein